MMKYQISYEIVKRFMSDLLKLKTVPILDILFTHLKIDTSRYESKIALLQSCLPLMNRHSAANFMKIIEEVLKEPANNSIFRNNLNPLRMGLMLYKLVKEVSEEHSYS